MALVAALAGSRRVKPIPAQWEAPEEKFTGFVFKIQANMDRNTATAWRLCAWFPVAYEKWHEAASPYRQRCGDFRTR